MLPVRESPFRLDYVLDEAGAGGGERLGLEPDEAVAHDEVGLRAEHHETPALQFLRHARGWRHHQGIRPEHDLSDGVERVELERREDPVRGRHIRRPALRAPDRFEHPGRDATQRGVGIGETIREAQWPAARKRVPPAREDLGSAGALQGGFLFSGIPTQVWEDPYAEGVRRRETDRDSTGLRLQWDRILGSALELTFSWRDISIDTERSGEGITSVTCAAACQDLLRRDGDQYSFDVSYLYRLGVGGRHLVRPMVRYTIDDREGEAISGDAYRLQLSYVFIGQGYSVASNVAFGGSSFDARNPIFGERTDSDGLVVDTTLFYRLPVESGRWQAVGSVLWGEGDSDVAFHDTEIFMINAGVMYRFGAR